MLTYILKSRWSNTLVARTDGLVVPLTLALQVQSRIMYVPQSGEQLHIDSRLLREIVACLHTYLTTLVRSSG